MEEKNKEIEITKLPLTQRKNLYCAVFWMQHYMQNRM